MEKLRIEEVVDEGKDRGKGNLLGIQPYMERADYASETAFDARINAYLKLAADKGWIRSRTIITLPEHLGTWLVAAGESPAMYTASTITTAMQPLVLRHLSRFALEFLRAREKDRVTASLFRVKAGEMARIYQSVFARLAKEYAVTIVGGSILLPEPSVLNGTITAGKGKLYNTAFLFHPDGRVDGQFSRKIYPTEAELPFVAAAPPGELPVFETPPGGWVFWCAPIPGSPNPTGVLKNRA